MVVAFSPDGKMLASAEVELALDDVDECGAVCGTPRRVNTEAHVRWAYEGVSQA